MQHLLEYPGGLPTIAPAISRPRVAALDRSMTLGNGGTAFDHVFLAMAHAQLGNQEQAHRWFAEAMRLDGTGSPGSSGIVSPLR